MSDFYDQVLNDFIAHAEGKPTSSVYKNSTPYIHKKSVPGYKHPNKEKLKGNANKVQIPEKLVKRVAAKFIECNNMSEAWRSCGSKFTLAGVAWRVKQYLEKKNV